MTDPIESTREDLHDAVDEAVDDAEARASIDARFGSLEASISALAAREYSQPAPSIDLSPIMERLDSLESRISAPVAPQAAPIENVVSQPAQVVESATESVEDAVDDMADVTENAAAQANLTVDTPDIPERPPIRSHLLMRRLFGK
jgi:hypothetical protein